MTQPRVSVGLPVYNAERHLRAALDAILAQTFNDFELIISDNGSGDRTQEICEVYTQKDSRIRYYRYDTNQGAAWNFNHVFELAEGEYFKWAAHDDVCKPRFIQKCVAALDHDPDIVLSHSRRQFLDDNGSILTAKHQKKLNADSLNPAKRFENGILVRHSCIEIFGVIRTKALRRTPGIGKYVGSDRNLLAELALLGRFHEIPEYLFCRRDHPRRSVSAYQKRWERIAWFDPVKAGTIHYPTWRRGAEYLRSIGRVPMKSIDRVLCYAQVLRWLGVKSLETRANWMLLAGDISYATKRFWR